MKVYAVIEHVLHEGTTVVGIFDSRSIAMYTANQMTAKIRHVSDVSYTVQPMVVHNNVKQYESHKEKRNLAKRLNWLRKVSLIPVAQLPELTLIQLEKYKHLL